MSKSTRRTSPDSFRRIKRVPSDTKKQHPINDDDYFVDMNTKGGKINYPYQMSS